MREMARKKKRKPFRAVKAVKEAAREKKNALPRGADERDRAKFAKARSYMIRRDDLVMCKNVRCRKRFEISGLQSVVFL